MNIPADEFAKKLIQKFINEAGGEDFEQLRRGVKCAMICVEELIEFSKSHHFSIREQNLYLLAVKDEILKQ